MTRLLRSPVADRKKKFGSFFGESDEAIKNPCGRSAQVLDVDGAAIRHCAQCRTDGDWPALWILK